MEKGFVTKKQVDKIKHCALVTHKATKKPVLLMKTDKEIFVTFNLYTLREEDYRLFVMNKPK